MPAHRCEPYTMSLVGVRLVSVRSGEGGPGSPSLFGSCLIRQLLDLGGGSGSLLAVSPFY